MLAAQQSTLERFRRVARSHQVPEAPNELDAAGEIEWLRSRLNRRVYCDAESWMIPSWALRDSRRSAKAPSENDRFDNDQRRNWTTIGGVGSREYAVCDSKGLLTVIPDCGSIDFWLLGPAGIIFPSMVPDEGPRLVLLSAEDQVYEWKTDLGPLEFSRLVYHSLADGKETIYNEIQVRNRSLERAKITFYAVVRPMSVNGVEPIEVAEYNPSKKAVYTNGLLAMMMSREPKSVYITEAGDTSLPTSITDLAPKSDSLSNAPSGLATVVLRFDVPLKPAGTERFFFVSPLVPTTKRDSLPAFPLDQRARDSAVQAWFEFMDSTLSGEFPDRNLNDMLSQSKAILAMQIRRSLFGQRPDLVELSWMEKAILLSALCKCNCISLAEDVSLEILRGIKAEELTDPSIAAPALWSTLHVLEYSQNASFLAEARQFLGQAIPAISKRAESYLSPALPETPKQEAQEKPEAEGVAVSSDKPDSEEAPTTAAPIAQKDETPVDHPAFPAPEPAPTPRHTRLSDFIEAAWAVEALRSAGRVYDHLGDAEHVKPLAALLAQYVTLVQESSKLFAEESAKRSPKEGLSESDVLDGVTFLGTLALLKTKSVDSQLVDRIEQAIAQKSTTIFKMVRLPDFAREHSVHLTLILAHYYAFVKNRAEAEALLRASLKFLSEYRVLPDWVDPKTGGGSRGSGCSLIAAADVLLLLRDMIMNEDGEDLMLLPGIPQDWYTSNNILVLRNARTPRGMVQIEMGASANQRQVEIRVQSLPREIDAYLPTARTVSMAKVYGGGLAGRFPSSSSPHIRIVPLSEDVVLAFHR